MKKFNFLLMVTTAVVCCVSSASANVLGPGGCAGLGTLLCPGIVTDFGTDPGFFPTNVQANTGLETFTSVGGRFSGTVDEVVALDSGTNALDFIFQVHNNPSSLDAIDGISSGLFDSFATDVGFSSTVFITLMGSGIRFPSDDTRSSSGNTVGFDFSFASGELMAGETTDLLVIKTNATSFSSGTVDLLSSGDFTSAGVFAPSPSTVPEPGSLVLFGSGLLGLAGVLRRKLKRS
jgi:hypothetical protein